MTITDQRLLGVILLACSIASVLLVAAVHRLGARRERVAAVDRHPAGRRLRSVK